MLTYRWERFLPHAFALMTFVIMYGALFWGGMPLMEDPDTPWHIMTGLKILELEHLPATDMWSFMSQGQRWYIMSWGWDVMIAKAYQLGGLPLVYVFVMAVAALSAAIITRHLLERFEVSGDVIVFTLIMVGLTLADFATARPHLFSAVCIVLFHYILHRSRASDDRCMLALLPAIMLIWVNCHAGFFAGFSLLGAYGLEALIRRNWSWFTLLLLTGIGCLIVLPINPYGFDAYYGVVDTLGSSINRYINEWQPFVFDNHWGTAAWGVILLAASYYGRAAIPLADKILTVIWFVALLYAQRNALIFVIVSAPYMALSLQKLLTKFEHLRRPQADLRQVLQRRGMRTGWMVGICLILSQSYSNINYLGESIGYGRALREDTAPGIAAYKKYCNNMRMLTEDEIGGRIIYETRGQCPVFYDGRTSTAYPESATQASIQFFILAPGWENMLRRYGIDGLFVMNKYPFVRRYEDGEFSKDWRRIYKDDITSIFIRK